MSASDTLREIAVLINQLADDLESVTPPADPGTVDPEPEDPPAQDPTVEQRLGDWFAPLNYSIKKIDERLDAHQFEDASVIYLIRHVFTTRDGSWEPDERRGSIDQWARDEYLKPPHHPDYNDDGGADHHIFACVIGPDGQRMKGKGVMYWSDGFHKLGDENYNGYVARDTKDRSGWANIPINISYVPERGESGPWCWAPLGAAEVFCGGGLPANEHVSTFVVWQAVERD